MKVLVVDFADGSQWEIPAKVVAGNRALYYAGNEENESEWYKVYMNELTYLLDDPESLVAWAKGNMDWSDINDVAIMVAPPFPTNYAEEWVNAEMGVREKED